MRKKIMAIDNDRFMLAFMADLLTEQGHDVETAQDGLSALEILKSFSPDIVFLDLVMPNISGDRLCRMMRKMPQLTNTYIAIVTATASEEPNRFAELGADACIAKGPLDEMSRRILAAVDDADRRTSPSPVEKTPNLKEIHSRGITRELLSIQRHIETLLNNICEGVLELNPEGKIIYANNIALSLFGGSEERLLGERFVNLIDKPGRRTIAGVLENIGAGLPETIDPFRLQLNGEWMLFKILPVEDNLDWSVLVVAVPEKKLPACVIKPLPTDE
jgi:CheY-like chemotaxis protein